MVIVYHWVAVLHIQNIKNLVEVGINDPSTLQQPNLIKQKKVKGYITLIAFFL